MVMNLSDDRNFDTSSWIRHFMPCSSKTPTPYAVFCSLGFVGLCVVLLIVGWQPYVEVEYLTRDPAAIADHPFYFGLLSNIGVLMWMASAAVCLFSATLLKLWQAKTDAIRFLWAFGGLSLLMGLDDLFLLHEQVFPIVFRTSQSSILLWYMAMTAACMCLFRKRLLRTQPLLFVFSLLLFFISISVDLIPFQLTNAVLAALFPVKFNGIRHLIEDGPKLLAIFVWLTYFVQAAIILLTEAKEKASEEGHWP